MKYKTVNAKRCIVCSKADYGENKGLEKVEQCTRCKSLVCVRCKGKCCETTVKENKQI